MIPSTNLTYVHLLGDSTLDNYYWMLNEKADNVEEAKANSVEGQLQTLLARSGSTVVNHAYDGFTTSSVLHGDSVGRVLGIQCPPVRSPKQHAYLRLKGINPMMKAKNYDVYPLKSLKENIHKDHSVPHYVVLSVGGNDFRERLANPFGILRETSNIRQRYFEILQSLTDLSHPANVRPILMFQYRTDVNSRIYTGLEIIGKVSVVVNVICMIGMALAAAALATGKINRVAGVILGLFSAAVLYTSSRVIPLKVTKGILRGQSIGVATLGGLMETFYRPILRVAQEKKIPVLDLPNIFNPFDDLYISDIEPNKKGSALIAECICKIITDEECNSKSSYAIYSKNALYPVFPGKITRYGNRTPDDWEVHYPSSK